MTREMFPDGYESLEKRGTGDDQRKVLNHREVLEKKRRDLETIERSWRPKGRYRQDSVLRVRIRYETRKVPWKFIRK